MGEPDRRSCLYRILPQTTGRSNCVVKTHPRAQTLAAFDPRNSPGQGERRQSLPGPHSRSCLFPTEGQVGGICSLTFSSATLVSLKAPENSRTPLPRIHTPLSTHPGDPVPSAVVADLQDREAGARRSRPGRRSGLESRGVPTPRTACGAWVRARSARATRGRPLKEPDSSSFPASLPRPRWCQEGHAAGDRPKHWDR